MESLPLFRRVVGDLLGSGYAAGFRASGRSMYPAIRDGERIIVEPVAPADVAKGDILFCETPGGLLAHRVVAVRGNGESLRFVLRGDTLRTDDGLVGPKQVLGKVVFVERRGRRIRLDGRRRRWHDTLHAKASRIRCWARQAMRFMQGIHIR